jgi:hypothetical protein
MRGYGAAMLYRNSDTVAVPTCAVVAWMQTAAGKAQKLPAKLYLRRAAAPLSEQRRGEEMRGTSSVRHELQKVQLSLLVFACLGGFEFRLRIRQR